MVAREALSEGYPLLNLLALLAIIAVAIAVGFYANAFYAVYLTTKGYRVSASTEVGNELSEKQEPISR